MKCRYFENSHCSSCEFLDKSYYETLIIKEKILNQYFVEPAKLLKPTIGLKDDAMFTRTKAKLAVFSKNNEIHFGFYNSKGEPTELEQCPLHGLGVNQTLIDVKSLFKKYKIIPYDLHQKNGEVKYLLISQSDVSGELLFRFVLRSKESLDRLKKLSADLLERHPLIKVITANIQSEHKAILEGDEEILLTKDSYIIHHFDYVQLAFGARSFFQVTPQIARKLYSALYEQVRADNPSSFLDLFCGVGAFSFYASRACADVVGVEISSDAIAFAKISNQLNKKSIDFVAGDVENYLELNSRKFDAIMVNPPRRGLNSSIIKTLLTLSPQFLYYSSCNVETLARDWLQLSQLYELKSLQIFDMFPYTSHFETLACMVLKSNE